MAEEILFSTKIDIDYGQALKDLNSLQKKIDNLTQKREVIIDLQQKLEPNLRSGQYELRQAQAELANMNIYSNSQADIDAQKEKVKELSSEFNKLVRQADAYEKSYEQTNAQLDVANRKAQELKDKLAGVEIVPDAPKKEKETKGFFERASQSADKFGKRVAGLAKRVLIFSVITQALRKIRELFSKILQADDQARQAINGLKASLYTLIQPLVNIILPVITKIISVLATMINYIASAVSMLFGSSLSKATSGAQKLYSSISGSSDALADANGQAKELNKTLAGIDEINVLDTDKDKGGSSAGGGGGGADLNSPDFSFMDKISKDIKKYAILGFEAMLVIGILLVAVSPKKGLGIALIAAGAAGLIGAIATEGSDGIANLISGPLETAMWIAGGALIVIGLLLIIFGGAAGLPLGIGCLVAGVGTLVAPIAAHWNDIIAFLQPAFDWVKQAWADMTAWINQAIEDVKNWINGAVETIRGWIETFVGWIQTIVDWITTAFNNAIAWIVQAYNDAINWITTAFNDAVDWVVQAFNDVVQFFTDAWNSIKQFGIDAWEGIKGVWQAVKDWFQQHIIDPLVNAWDTATSAISGFFSNIWNGIKSGFVNAINAIIGGIESAINWMIDAVNGFLFGVNTVIGAVGNLFGANWGIGYVNHVYLKRIPALAQGGVIKSASLFYANENGAPEFVGRFGNNTGVANTGQMVDAIAGGVRDAQAEQNQLLREQNELLRALLDKETGISVGDITNALSRQNRISGRTIVQVG